MSVVGEEMEGFWTVPSGWAFRAWQGDTERAEDTGKTFPSRLGSNHEERKESHTTGGCRGGDGRYSWVWMNSLAIPAFPSFDSPGTAVTFLLSWINIFTLIDEWGLGKCSGKCYVHPGVLASEEFHQVFFGMFKTRSLCTTGDWTPELWKIRLSVQSGQASCVRTWHTTLDL